MRKIKAQLIGLAMIGMSLALLGCKGVVVGTSLTQLDIQGTVTDAQTGAPIAGATVAIAFANSVYTTRMTDADGYYRISCSVYFSNNVLRVTAQGYITQDRSLETIARLQTVNVALERQAN